MPGIEFKIGLSLLSGVTHWTRLRDRLSMAKTDCIYSLTCHEASMDTEFRGQWRGMNVNHKPLSLPPFNPIE